VNATNKLLDKFLQTCLSGMDKEIAEKLRVKHSAVSNWRHGRAHPDAESIEKMALAIGEPVAPWLMLIEAERARTAEGKRVWLRHAAALGITFALVMAILPSRVHAMTTDTTMRAASAQFDISKIDILVVSGRSPRGSGATVGAAG